MNFLKEGEEKRNHWKVLLKDVYIDKDHLKEWLMFTEERKNV